MSIALHPAALYFVKGLGKLGITVSAKTTLSPARSKAMRDLHRALAATGIGATLTDAGRELGIDTFAGGRKGAAGGSCKGHGRNAEGVTRGHAWRHTLGWTC